MANLESNTRIAKNTLFLSVRMVFVLFINLFTTRAVLAGLGADDFGVYNVVGGFVSMFTFLSHSISNGIQRFYNFELGKNGIEGAQKVYLTSLLIQGLIIIVLLIFTESFGLWYLNHKMVIPAERLFAARFIFQFSILSFVFALLQSPYSASIVAHERMDFFAIMSVVDAIFKLLIALSIPHFLHDKLVVYGLLILFISLFNFIVYYYYSRSHFEEIRIKKYFNVSLIKKMLSFSGWNVFGVFSEMLKEQGLNLIINLFFGPIVNAARAIAYQVSTAIRGFVSSANMAVRPQIVQSYAQDNKRRSLSLVFSMTKLITIIYIALGCPIILEINFILHLWLGDYFPEHTASFVIIVLLISLVNNMNSVLSAIVHASGKMRDYQLYGGSVSMLSVPFAYLALYLGGSPESAFWVSLLFTVVMQLVSLFVVQSIVGLSVKRYFVDIVVPMTLVTIVAIIVPALLHTLICESFVRLLIVASASLISSVISFYFLAMSTNENTIAKQIVLKRFKKKHNL